VWSRPLTTKTLPYVKINGIILPIVVRIIENLKQWIQKYIFNRIHHRYSINTSYSQTINCNRVRLLVKFHVSEILLYFQNLIIKWQFLNVKREPLLATSLVMTSRTVKGCCSRDKQPADIQKIMGSNPDRTSWLHLWWSVVFHLAAWTRISSLEEKRSLNYLKDEMVIYLCIHSASYNYFWIGI